MAIERVEIKDFQVFKGEFTCDFCPGVNVLIGGNGTGKSTLMRVMCRLCDNKDTEYYFFENNWLGRFGDYPFEYLRMETISEGVVNRISVKSIRIDGKGDLGDRVIKDGRWVEVPMTDDYTETETMIWGDCIQEIVYTQKGHKNTPSMFIPENDLLSNARGLVETATYGNAQLLLPEVEVIAKSRVLPSVPEQPLYRKICDLIGGEPEHDGQSFFMKRQGIDKRIPFTMEASGFRKFGLLALLVRNEMIKPGTVLFWDEPENSLNPLLMEKLVEILIELSRNKVQIFLATHSELLAKEIDIQRKESDEIKFLSLYEDDGKIKANSNKRFDLLEPNHLISVPVKQYDREIQKELGGNE
ncbi:MAG: ATP-binding protein [Oscillospiraceae bacterium]|nr:ATP-binding protein [Oscillospiraceae bacterium]